jgi:large subunit ribosomal protein L23
MIDASSVLVRPVVSEKTYALMEVGTYVFVVDPRASKVEIRRAVEDAFNVHVTRVNTLTRKGKKRRDRKTRRVGYRPTVKRALVTLVEGDRIDVFES